MVVGEPSSSEPRTLMNCEWQTIDRTQWPMVLIAVAVALLFGSACSYDKKAHPSYCSSTNDCADGYKCAKEHYCISSSACTVDSDCQTGFICNASQICTKNPECQEGKKESCYEGAEGTVDIGVCRSGQRVCVGGSFTDCLGQVVGSAEECNGLDDDCDGKIDNTDHAECDTGLLGVCAKGEMSCTGSFAVCRANAIKTPEICNGVDDDCDGITDEGTAESCYPEAQIGCEKSGASYVCKGVCSPGSRECTQGVFGDCTGAIIPKIESCTVGNATYAQDEDCDGEVDENCPCTPGQDVSQECYAGPADTQGIGACKKGTQSCESSSRLWGSCAGQVVPVPETCLNMGQDDDCDGTIDDVDGLGDFCVQDNYHGICREGVTQCVSGTLACVTVEPGGRPEVCDGSMGTPGTDEDCDGLTDEGFDLATDKTNCGACGRVCAEGQTCCQGSCVTVATDPRFCGSCRNACGAGLSCCGGQCADLERESDNCGACGTFCGSGSACCSGTCSNTQVDPLNCGECGNTCAGGQYCCSGQCSTESCSCLKCEQSGGTCCGSLCVDAKTDSSNCGRCGEVCAENTECMDGICCATGEINCLGSCADSTRDEANCGGCGVACDAHLTCCDGCVDTRSNSRHCGGCDQPCTWNKTCSNGLCCTNGLTHCSGECINLSTDERFCGDCATACTDEQTCCDGKCVNLQNDNTACGACGTVCSGDSPCCQGTCVPHASETNESVDIKLCSCATTCPTGYVCCGDQCVSLAFNESHCGACFNTCSTTTCCLFGRCSSSSYCSTGY
jgi:hypothetical protein